MLIAYVRLHRQSLVASPAREMVFARGELNECGRTGITFLLIEGSVCGPDRIVDLGTFSNYSAGTRLESPPEMITMADGASRWCLVKLEARLRV